MIRILEPRHRLAQQPRFLDWLRRHGVKPQDTYLIVNLDDEVMVVHQFATRNGQKFCVLTEEDAELAYEPVLGDAAVRQPYAVEIREPMPH